MCSVKRTYWLIFLVLVALIGSMLPLALTRTVQAEENKSNLEELIANADSVIEGTVVEHTSYWNDEHNRIYTSVALAVGEKFKGTLEQETINVILPGGEVDGVGQWLSDMPAFDQSERAIVFLNELPKERLPKASRMQFTGEQFEVYGGFRGKMAIKQGKVGDLPEARFKELIKKATEGHSLSPVELDEPSSPATFPYSYLGYSWPHPPNPAVVYKINENTADCTGEGATVQTAAATWNAAGARFSFSYSGGTTATTYSRNGVNEILWNNFGSGGTIGHAIIWYSGSTILETDMEFNDYYSWSTAASCPANSMDVETVALHELGHWLGLGDLYNAEDVAKVMYGYGSLGATKRVLHSDDIAGIRSIYGAVTSAPTVTNSIGASDVTSDTATLNGEVTSTGGENPTVHIYWGDNDGGTDVGNWDHDENLGVKGAGTFYADVSGLVANTTYYYRCYAVNSGGSDWADNTGTFTTLALVQKLIGVDEGAIWNYSLTSNYFCLARFQAEQNGDVSIFRFRASGSGNVKVGIYSDSSGEPGSRLSSVGGTAVSEGWNSITIPSRAVVSGSYYWLAMNSDVKIACYNSAGPGTFRFKALAYGADLPVSAGAGLISANVGVLWAGWGESTLPTLPGAPDLLAPGNTINFEWNSVAGATKYWLQVNTNFSFTGTNIINADVGNVTSYEVTGLTLGTNYYWRVRAGNDAGWGDWSAGRSVLASTIP